MCHWAVYVHPLLVTVHLLLSGCSLLLDTGWSLLLGLPVCYRGCVHKLLVNVCLGFVAGLYPYNIGYCVPFT